MEASLTARVLAALRSRCVWAGPSFLPIPWRAPTQRGRPSPRARGPQFVLGRNSVIQGWEKGFASMKKGEKAVLTCKPEYAYGASGSPPKIPANATLKFEVELLDFHPKKKERWEMTTEERVEEVRRTRPRPRAGPLTARVADHRRRSSRRRATSTSRPAGGRTPPPATATRTTWRTNPATVQRTTRTRRTTRARSRRT